MNGQIDEAHHVSSGYSSEKLASMLFSKLSKTMIENLYHVYEADSHLFNYIIYTYFIK